MSEGPVAQASLIARIKDRMQQSRQLCPFFQLEQLAADSPAPAGFETGLLRHLPLVIPEIAAHEPGGLSPEQQQALARPFPAWLVAIESSFCGGAPGLLQTLRRQEPDRYLIAHDLVVDEYQILQARTAGANAITLSSALLGPRRTQLYFGKIRFWEMEPLLEVHDPDDARLALELKARAVLLTALPGEPGAVASPALHDAVTLLRGIPLLIYAGEDPALLARLPEAGIQGLSPGSRLWQQPDPANRLQALARHLTQDPGQEPQTQP